eukprot:gene1741-3364_t
MHLRLTEISKKIINHTVGVIRFRCQQFLPLIKMRISPTLAGNLDKAVSLPPTSQARNWESTSFDNAKARLPRISARACSDAANALVRMS